MINRGTPPATDGLCIPGGRLEVGESLAAGAVREVKEETGIVRSIYAAWCTVAPDKRHFTHFYGSPGCLLFCGTPPFVHGQPGWLTLLPVQDVQFRHTPQPGTLGLYTEPGPAGTLPSPRPITVVDGLYYGDDSTLSYHYVINEVLLQS